VARGGGGAGGRSRRGGAGGGGAGGAELEGAELEGAGPELGGGRRGRRLGKAAWDYGMGSGVYRCSGSPAVRRWTRRRSLGPQEIPGTMVTGQPLVLA
jgi:hypothetical protein